MGCLKFLALPIGLLAILVFWLNEPLPPNTANPVMYKVVAAFMTVNDKVAELQAWWTEEDVRIVEHNNLEKLSMAGRRPDPDVVASEETFAGVKVFVYQPKTKKSGRPALIYFHGGGFKTGHPVIYEPLFHKFVKQLDMVVMAVRYRLTPEVKAPAPHEDCEKAVQHFFINAEKYGVNPDLVGAAGDSAGGNLAASMSLMLRDQGENEFIFQLLIYPWVQGLDLQTPSYQRNCPTAMSIMSHEAMASYVGSFLGLPPRVFPELIENKHVKPETWDKYKKYFILNELPKKGIPANYKPVRPSKINEAVADFVEADLTNPHLFPLLADNLANLPPAYVLTVENDPLMDEGVWFSNRLVKAENKVVHDHSPDGFHGMIGMQDPVFGFDPAYKAADNMLKFTADVLRDVKKTLQKKPPVSAKKEEAKVEKQVKTEEKVTKQQVKVEKQVKTEENVKKQQVKVEKQVKDEEEVIKQEVKVEKQAKKEEKVMKKEVKVEKQAPKVEKVAVSKVQDKKDDKKELPKPAKADPPSKPVDKKLDEKKIDAKKANVKKAEGKKVETKKAETEKADAKKTDAKKAETKKAGNK